MTKKHKVREILAILDMLYPESKTELIYEKDYELLFAVIMSAQTTDKQVNKVTSKLFQKYTSLEDFASADVSVLTQDISSIGLYRAKAKNIIASAKRLVDVYNSKVPNTMQDLTTLPGAARKTANVVLNELYGIHEGIAVDTHVARLSQKLGLTKNTDPKKIEQDLMKIVPRDRWGDFSHKLILYGRYHWTARDKEHTGPLSHLI